MRGGGKGDGSKCLQRLSGQWAAAPALGGCRPLPRLQQQLSSGAGCPSFCAKQQLPAQAKAAVQGRQGTQQGVPAPSNQR